MPASACGAWLSCRGEGGLWDFSFIRDAGSVPAPNHDHDHDAGPAYAHVRVPLPSSSSMFVPLYPTSSSSKATDPPSISQRSF